MLLLLVVMLAPREVLMRKRRQKRQKFSNEGGSGKSRMSCNQHARVPCKGMHFESYTWYLKVSCVAPAILKMTTFGVLSLEPWHSNKPGRGSACLDGTCGEVSQDSIQLGGALPWSSDCRGKCWMSCSRPHACDRSKVSKHSSPFLREFALQINGIKCSPDPDLVFFELVFPRVFLFEGLEGGEARTWDLRELWKPLPLI